MPPKISSQQEAQLPIFKNGHFEKGMLGSLLLSSFMSGFVRLSGENIPPAVFLVVAAIIARLADQHQASPRMKDAPVSGRAEMRVMKGMMAGFFMASTVGVIAEHPEWQVNKDLAPITRTIDKAFAVAKKNTVSRIAPHMGMPSLPKKWAQEIAALDPVGPTQK